MKDYEKVQEKEIKIVKLATDEEIDEFWVRWENYMRKDIIPNSDIGEPWNDKNEAHFFSKEYIPNTMKIFRRETDPLRLIKFTINEKPIGFCEYVTYYSEDGKCMVCEFFILEEFRDLGYGTKCFSIMKDMVLKEGASYFSLNAANTKALRFWKRQRFKEYKIDENHPDKAMIYTYLK